MGSRGGSEVVLVVLHLGWWCNRGGGSPLAVQLAAHKRGHSPTPPTWWHLVPVADNIVSGHTRQRTSWSRQRTCYCTFAPMLVAWCMCVTPPHTTRGRWVVGGGGAVTAATTHHFPHALLVHPHSTDTPKQPCYPHTAAEQSVCPCAGARRRVGLTLVCGYEWVVGNEWCGATGTTL